MDLGNLMSSIAWEAGYQLVILNNSNNPELRGMSREQYERWAVYLQDEWLRRFYDRERDVYRELDS